MESEASENPSSAADAGPVAGSTASFASQRALSLRAMFPTGARTAYPAPVPASLFDTPPEAAAPTDGAAVPPDGPAASARRWWTVSAIVGGLVLTAAAGIVAVRSTTVADPAPGRQLATPPGVAIGAAPDPTLDVTVASPAAAVSVGTTTRPARPSPSRRRASSAAPSTPDAPITAYSACTTTRAALFTVTFTEPFPWHHVFIDLDADPSTGYRVPGVRDGLGADLMVENDKLYRSTGARWGWTALGDVSPLLSRAGDTYRWQVPLAVAGSFRVVFNGAGTDTEVSSPVLAAGRC